MAMALRVFLAAGIVLAILYLLLRFNSAWVYLFLDRAKRNNRTRLSPDDELSRYFKLDSRGTLDKTAKWPGWDGWYFFFIPHDANLPVQMVRCSLMTGLYGLEGIDNYDKVSLRLENSAETEFLSLIPTKEKLGSSVTNFNHLSHHYLPKASSLDMDLTRLDVSIRGVKLERDEETEPYGRVRGKWPAYQFEFTHPETGITVSLRYIGQNVHWWADMPGIFSYFAAWGDFEGQITFPLGTSSNDTHHPGGQKETYRLTGAGCFEHGCARKPLDFDILWGPLRFLKSIAPRLRFIRYHYELFSSEDQIRGGFMVARGFGIDFRNRGGIFLPESYQEIQQVAIEYCTDAPVDPVDWCIGGTPTIFYRKWKVRAQTSAGSLEYTAYRDFPPALVAANMSYYHFRYEGTWGGRAVKGKGYGEYAHI